METYHKMDRICKFELRIEDDSKIILEGMPDMESVRGKYNPSKGKEEHWSDRRRSKRDSTKSIGKDVRLWSHIVTADDGSFSSENMDPGNTFTFTFTFATQGTYTYHWSYCPWMKGTVIVKWG